MRGLFRRADGLILPNNISLAGAAMILAAAFRDDVPTFYAALCVGYPAANMTELDLAEPTIGTNGYARIAIPRSSVGWPTQVVVGAEASIASEWMTWAPTGSGFDQPTQRVALVSSATYDSTNPVYALSAPLNQPLNLTPTSPVEDLRYQYQIYL